MSEETTLAYAGESPAAEPGIPLISGYDIIATIARGGMGQVFAATDRKLGREVAIKTLLPGASAERFVTEAQIAARLPHPGIPPVHELGTLADGTPYLVMKLVRGRTLADLLAERTSPADGRPRFVQIFEQIAQAVGFAHSRGVVHRDLKPLNVMVGEHGEVQVMDWGLAKEVRSAEPEVRTDEGAPSATDATQAGAILGTPGYMSPEQARGEAVDARADVFALGSLLAAILTGAPAFVGTTVGELVRRTAAADLADVRDRLASSGADAELVALAERCLAARPDDRPADGHAVAEEVARYRAGVEARLRRAETDRAEAAVRDGEQAKRRRILRVAGGVLLAVLMAGVAVSGYFAHEAGQRAEAEKAARKTADEQKGLADQAAAKASEEKGRADKEAEEARQQKQRADDKAAEANKNLKLAEQREGEMKAQLRRAEDARHAIQIDLALSARAARDYDRVAALLTDMRPEYHDAWETRYVRALWNKEAWPLRSFVGHTGTITVVAFSPDSARVLTGAQDRTARLWDAATGREVAVLTGHTQPVAAVAFSPDGKLLATATADRTARLWDAESGKARVVLRGHTGPVAVVSFSCDSSRVLTAGFDRTARLWDAASGKELAVLKGHTQAVTRASFSPDGLRVLTCSGDKTARVWDAASGKELAVLKGHTTEVRDGAFSPDGRRVLTGGDASARLWDAATGAEQTVLRHASAVEHVAFSPDGMCVLAGDSTNFKLWNAETGLEWVAFQGRTGAAGSLAYSPKGTCVLVAGDDALLPKADPFAPRNGVARLWHAVGGEELATFRGHVGPVLAVAFSPDGKTVVTAGKDGVARLWDAGASARPAARSWKGPGVECVAFSGDGRSVLTGERDGTARLYDAATGAQRAALTGHVGEVISAAFSPDGTVAVTGSRDGTARLWDARVGQPRAVLSGHPGGVASVCFSPDGLLVFTGTRRPQGGGQPGDGRLWEVATGKQVAALALYGGGSLVFSPDSRHVVTSGPGGNAYLAVARTGRPVFHFQGNGTVFAFSRDGQLVAGAYGSTTHVWHAASGAPQAHLEGHTGMVHSIAFSPDGQRVATAGADQKVRLWDAETGQEKLTLDAPSGSEHLAFRRDGQSLVVRSPSAGTREWDADLGRERLVLREEARRTSAVALSGDGTRLLTAGLNSVHLRDIPTGRDVASLPGALGPVLVAPDGRHFLTRGPTNTGRVWSLATGREVACLQGHARGVTAWDFGPGGRVVTGGAIGDATARVWDLPTGEELATLTGHVREITHATLSPDGRLALTASTDRTARLWDAATGQQVANLTGHTGSPLYALFSPDGKQVLVSGSDAAARLWDARTVQEPTVLKGAIGPYEFSPNGRHLLSAADRGGRLWDRATGQLVAELAGNTVGLTQVAFSQTGERILTAGEDGMVRLWDAAGKPLAVLRGHTERIRTARFSPDGKHVLTGSQDRTARLWNVATGDEVAVLRGHTGGVTFAAFTPDGKTIITGGDGTVRLWDAEP